MDTTLIEGPIPGPFVMWTTGFELGPLGYVAEEYFLSGSAHSFRHLTEPEDDGEWPVEPADTGSYTTRLVVYRPIEASLFSGSVHVEWLNVSGGLDAAPGWLYGHRHVLRSGDVWVGVSAQQVGIDGGGLDLGMHLKAVDPDRYRGLQHPGDAYSYDIFTQAIEAIRGPSGPFGQRDTGPVLAMGSSQSAMALVTYVNAVDPHAKVIDGCLIHGRGAEGLLLDRRHIPWRYGEQRTGSHRVRHDARVPVLTVQSESDVVLLGGGRARQPDSEMFRLWELAGAAHFDAYGLHASLRDNGELTSAELVRLVATVEPEATSGRPYSRAWQMHYVLQSAMAHLERWARRGEPPPTSPRLASPDVEGSGLLVDGHGLATGGLRTPWVEVPTATHSGLRDFDGESQIDLLFGESVPFEQADLTALFPRGRSEYMERFAAALEESVAGGFILSADQDEILGVAELEWAGPS